jgi:hypothetical protein
MEGTGGEGKEVRKGRKGRKEGKAGMPIPLQELLIPPPQYRGNRINTRVVVLGLGSCPNLY